MKNVLKFILKVFCNGNYNAMIPTGMIPSV